VEHFGRRLDVMEGKAMIVCMSRRICADLYNALVKLRPEWHHHDDDKGMVKVVMTGSASDEENLRPHIRNKPLREALAVRFKDQDRVHDGSDSSQPGSRGARYTARGRQESRHGWGFKAIEGFRPLCST